MTLTRGSNPARPLFDSLVDWTVLLAIFTAFAISNLTLAAFGVAYDTAGGSALQKLHPASWIFAIALVMNLLRQADLPGYLRSLPRRFPGAALFTAMWILLIATAVIVQRTPIMPLVDTFFPALAILVLYEDMDPGAQRAARLLLHAFMFANASLGIFESVAHFRLTPFIENDALIVDDLRSTALLGHPLLNAGTTSYYILMLFFGGDRSLSPPARWALIVPQLLALIPFGGRTALVLTLAILALASLPTLAGALNGRRFDRRVALALALGLPLLLGAGVLAYSYGYVDNLLDRFANDKGSAQARVIAFQLFGAFSFEDLLLGPDPQRLAWLQNTLGIEYGIENSWLGLLFQYGALMALFFAIGFLALLSEFWRRSQAYALIIVLSFILQISSAASISVKSFSFNQFAILLLVVFQGGGVVSPRAKLGQAIAQSNQARLTRA